MKYVDPVAIMEVIMWLLTVTIPAIDITTVRLKAM